MNTELFVGKTKVYAKAQPHFPEEVADYSGALVTPDLIMDSPGSCCVGENCDVDDCYEQLVKVVNISNV